MMYAGRFKFLKIFHHDDFEKSLSKAVEAFNNVFFFARGLTRGHPHQTQKNESGPNRPKIFLRRV